MSSPESKKKSKDGEFKTITVEAAKQGWIVREQGKPAEVFVRWESVVNKLKNELTTTHDNG